MDSGPNEGKVHPACFSSNPLNFLTPAQFLTRLEHTSPPVKELTTEEKLKEAVRLLKNCYSIALFEDYNEARAFIKSIKS